MNSKLELRHTAVNIAVNVEGANPENVIKVAKDVYDFILGDAELPEKYDPNSQMEYMSKLAGMMNFNKTDNEKEVIKEADFTEEPTATDNAV